jgi:predicted ABC-type transport system involved in lysophospholipase L1 biosynthesis ATPase subunit
LAKTIIDLKRADLTLGSAAASVHVLKGIDLEIAAGESVGIVGPSGSGKSTLLMVLAGLEKLDSGEINIADTPLHAMSEDQVADFRGRNIGIVFQSFHLIANMTALENVAVPLELANVPNPFEIARRELKSVGLGERLNHYPGQLSGGEQQRVAIARALAPSPALADRRRTDRQSRHRHRPPDRRPPVFQTDRARHDAAAGHPRQRACQALLAPDPRPLRQDRGRQRPDCPAAEAAIA